MKKRVLAIALAAALAGSMFAACGGESSSSSAASSTATEEASKPAEAPATEEASKPAEAPAAEEIPALTIATNDFGQGEYSLDINSWIVESTMKAIGGSVDVVDNQFTVDNIITQLRSQLSKGPDGVTMIGIAETVFPAISKACQEANVPYSFFATPPIEADVAAMEDDPLYAGTVLFEPEEEAAYLAQAAYDAGCRKAVLLAGAEGDYNHDHRIIGFTNKFEELGGQVLDYARCASPAEGDDKGSNLVSANKDCDCAVGLGAGYITSLEAIREKMGLDYKIYGCDTTPNLIQDVKNGKVEIISCGANTGAAFATILVVNKILGHPILDERGKAPFTKALTLYFCDQENAVQFEKFWEDAQRAPLTEEQIKSLIGPNVSYDDFIAALENHAQDAYDRIATY